MKKLIYPIVIFMLSCHSNNEEKARLDRLRLDSIAFAKTAYEDSLINATRIETKLKIEEENRLKDSINEIEKKNKQFQIDKKSATINLKNKIAEKETEIRLAWEKLEKIKSYHFGRTPSEKELQIKNQYKKIQFLEQEFDNLKDDLSEMKAGNNIESLINKYKIDINSNQFYRDPTMGNN